MLESLLRLFSIKQEPVERAPDHVPIEEVVKEAAELYRSEVAPRLMRGAYDEAQPYMEAVAYLLEQRRPELWSIPSAFSMCTAAGQLRDMLEDGNAPPAKVIEAYRAYAAQATMAIDARKI